MGWVPERVALVTWRRPVPGAARLRISIVRADDGMPTATLPKTSGREGTPITRPAADAGERHHDGAVGVVARDAEHRLERAGRGRPELHLDRAAPRVQAGVARRQQTAAVDRLEVDAIVDRDRRDGEGRRAHAVDRDQLRRAPDLERLHAEGEGRGRDADVGCGRGRVAAQADEDLRVRRVGGVDDHRRRCGRPARSAQTPRRRRTTRPTGARPAGPGRDRSRRPGSRTDVLRPSSI